MDDLPQVNTKEFLRPILFGLTEEDLDDLACAACVRTFLPGEAICREGEPAGAFFFVVSGRVAILKQMDDQTERLLHHAGPAEFFGEMAIVQEGGRTATVRAVEPTVALEIGREEFLNVLGRSPSLAIRILVHLTDRLRSADQQAIAELRKAYEDLRRTYARLERLDRTKADFIQVSAHELRTPVAALKGYAQMMQSHPAVKKDPSLGTLVEGVIAGTDRLHRIFDNILDLSRVVAGGLEVHPSPVSLAIIFQSIRLEFREALAQRNLTMEIIGLSELPFCLADPDLIYKAFRHLVNNALKYTPDGGQITVSGRRVLVPDLGECVEVVVADTGIGIAPEDLALIFEKFYRTGEVALHSSGAVSFKGGGPGLGLAIAQGVILAHGGRIWAESPGYDEQACPGSRFIVRLPLGGTG